MSELEPTNRPVDLVSTLEQQRDLARELDKLCEQQRALIDGAKTDDLLRLLTRRQDIIEQLLALQGQLPFDASAGQVDLSGVSESERGRVRDLIGETGELLARVMSRDEQDQSSLQTGRGRLRKEIADLGTAKQARHAYVPSARMQTRFADRKG